MNDSIAQLPPEIDFSSFDFTNLTDSLLPDEIKSPSTGEKYLVFFLDRELYAVSTKQVAEVAPSLPVTPLPNAPEWLVGIANLRNEIISVVSLPRLLKKEKSTVSPKAKLVVLHSPDSAPSVAFTVARLGEIINLRNEEIRFDDNEKSSYISGKAVHLANHLNLIDAKKILSSLVV